MCGIVGFTGSGQAAPVLLDGLAKLEYRGYDSAGIALFDTLSNIRLIKRTGKVAGASPGLRQRAGQLPLRHRSYQMGYTRRGSAMSMPILTMRDRSL